MMCTFCIFFHLILYSHHFHHQFKNKSDLKAKKQQQLVAASNKQTKNHIMFSMMLVIEQHQKNLDAYILNC